MSALGMMYASSTQAFIMMPPVQTLIKTITRPNCFDRLWFMPSG